MNPDTAADLFQQARHLYQAKEFAQAYALLSQNVARFPDEAYRLTHWQMCLAALAGKPEEAVSTLENALQSGLSFPKELLRDPDLAALQGNERFESLIGESDARFETIRAQARPELVVVEPQGFESGASRSLPLVLAFHGNHSDIPATRPYWEPVVQKGYLLALAQSSQLLGPGMFIWDDTELAITEVTRHIEKLMEAYPVDADHVILGGFSMGGRLAALLSLSGTVKTRGFISVAPYIDDLGNWKEWIQGAKDRGVRGYILAGELDTVSGSRPQELAEMLNQAGIPCKLEIMPGIAHGYAEDYAGALDRALEFILG